ncbi:unnamed protein product [Closterium sp. NIES-65]|nr:unnamed protein product [Closterium sp. NIES-65]
MRTVHSMFPKSNHETFATKLYQTVGAHRRFDKPKLSQTDFTIEHYAGKVGKKEFEIWVTYQTDLFLEKNKDYVVMEHQALLGASIDPFVAALFPMPSGDKAKTKFTSLGSGFKQQLAELMSTLSHMDPHYVRCVKPNGQYKPGYFENPSVIHQLRCGGVLEAIRISCAGYPTRRPFDEFLDRFSVLAPDLCDGRRYDDKTAVTLMLQRLGFSNFQVGRTKVFLRAGQMADLDALRAERLMWAARVIQRAWRSWRQFMRPPDSAVLQLAARGDGSSDDSEARHLTRQYYSWLREEAAAVTIQKHVRRYTTQLAYEHTRYRAIIIQAAAPLLLSLNLLSLPSLPSLPPPPLLLSSLSPLFFSLRSPRSRSSPSPQPPGHLTRQYYSWLREEAAAVTIQKHVRRYTTQLAYEHTRYSAIIIQAAFRGMLCRKWVREIRVQRAATRIQVGWEEREEERGERADMERVQEMRVQRAATRMVGGERRVEERGVGKGGWKKEGWGEEGGRKRGGERRVEERGVGRGGWKKEGWGEEGGRKRGGERRVEERGVGRGGWKKEGWGEEGGRKRGGERRVEERGVGRGGWKKEGWGEEGGRKRGGERRVEERGVGRGGWKKEGWGEEGGRKRGGERRVEERGVGRGGWKKEGWGEEGGRKRGGERRVEERGVGRGGWKKEGWGEEGGRKRGGERRVEERGVGRGGWKKEGWGEEGGRKRGGERRVEERGVGRGGWKKEGRGGLAGLCSLAGLCGANGLPPQALERTFYPPLLPTPVFLLDSSLLPRHLPLQAAWRGYVDRMDFLRERWSAVEARQAGALREAKTKLEKQLEELTWRLQLEKRMRLDLEEAKAAEIQRLQAQVEDLRSELDDTRTRLESQVDDTRRQLDESQGRLEEAQGRLEEAQARLEEAQGKVEQAEAEVRQLREQSERMADESARLAQQLAERPVVTAAAVGGAGAGGGVGSGGRGSLESGGGASGAAASVSSASSARAAGESAGRAAGEGDGELQQENVQLKSLLAESEGRLARYEAEVAGQVQEKTARSERELEQTQADLKRVQELYSRMERENQALRQQQALSGPDRGGGGGAAVGAGRNGEQGAAGALAVQSPQQNGLAPNLSFGSPSQSHGSPSQRLGSPDSPVPLALTPASGNGGRGGVAGMSPLGSVSGEGGDRRFYRMQSERFSVSGKGSRGVVGGMAEEGEWRDVAAGKWIRGSGNFGRGGMAGMSPLGSVSGEGGDRRFYRMQSERHSQEQETLLKALSATSLGYSNKRPLAACIVYKCLLHWRAFEAERTSIFDRINRTIRSAVEEDDRALAALGSGGVLSGGGGLGGKSMGRLAYWLSNTSCLLVLLQRTLKASGGGQAGPAGRRKGAQGGGTSGRMAQMGPQMGYPPSPPLPDGSSSLKLVEAKYPALLFRQQLTAYVEKVFGLIRDNLKRDISPILGQCIQVGVISLLGGTWMGVGGGDGGAAGLLLFRQQLTAYVEKVFGLIRDNLKRDISPILGQYIQGIGAVGIGDCSGHRGLGLPVLPGASKCTSPPPPTTHSPLSTTLNQAPRVSRSSYGRQSSSPSSTAGSGPASSSPPSPWHAIIASLSSLLATLKGNHVAPFLIRKMFAQVFSFINVQLFNRLLGNGEYVKAGLQKVQPSFPSPVPPTPTPPPLLCTRFGPLPFSLLPHCECWLLGNREYVKAGLQELTTPFLLLRRECCSLSNGEYVKAGCRKYSLPLPTPPLSSPACNVHSPLLFQLIAPPGVLLLLRRECCSLSNGEYVKAGLQEVQQWMREAGEESMGRAWEELRSITQAVGFLSPTCRYCKKTGHTIDECFKLKKKKELEESSKREKSVFQPSVHVSTSSSAEATPTPTPPPAPSTPQSVPDSRYVDIAVSTSHHPIFSTWTPLVAAVFILTILLLLLLFPYGAPYASAFTASSFNMEQTSSWLVDSGASSHICSDRSLFSSLKKPNEEILVRFGGGETYKVVGVGTVVATLRSPTSETTIQLDNVLFLPSSVHNLLSVRALGAAGVAVSFPAAGRVVLTSDDVPIGEGYTRNNLFYLQLHHGSSAAPSIKPTACPASTTTSSYLWHRRFGHLNMQALSTLHRQQLVTGLHLSSTSIPPCISCYRGKQTRQPFGVSHSRTTAPLQLIHSDIAGPLSYGTTIGGARYLLTFIDDYSRHITVYLLRHRSEALSCFKAYVTRLDDRSTAGIMVGYGHLDGTKAYRIYIPSQHRVILSRDVIFMEPSAPPSDDSRDPPSSSPPTSSSLPPPTHPSSLDPISPPSPSPTIPSSANPHPQSPNLPAPATSSPPPLFSNLPLPSTPQDFHLPSFSPPSSPPPPHCTTRSSPPSPSALPDPSLFSFLKVLPSPSEPIDFTLPPLSNTSANAALHHHYEPQTIHEARTGPDAAEWIKAADAELAALHANDTYSIVPRPPKCKPIPCKWIFKVKENADGAAPEAKVLHQKPKKTLEEIVLHQKPKKSLEEIVTPLCLSLSTHHNDILGWKKPKKSLEDMFTTLCPSLSTQQLYRIATMYWDGKYGNMLSSLPRTPVLHQKPKKSLEEIVTTLCPSLSTQQLYRIATMYWDGKYGTHTVSTQVIQMMRARMSEEARSPAATGSFLLDDDSSIPFGPDDYAHSMEAIDIPAWRPLTFQHGGHRHCMLPIPLPHSLLSAPTPSPLRAITHIPFGPDDFARSMEGIDIAVLPVSLPLRNNMEGIDIAVLPVPPPLRDNPAFHFLSSRA